MRFNSVCTYAFFCLSIFFWWAIAFQQPVALEHEWLLHPSKKEKPALAFEKNLLIKCPDRELIRKALLGDAALMAELITEWNIDALLLQNEGFSAEYLDQAQFIRSQTLARILSAELEEQALSDTAIIDDLGLPHDPHHLRTKFLPQTYLSAGILLALADPHQISALPKGFKEQNEIYDSPALQAIALEFDRFSSETLATNLPDCAFVSLQYSHPGSIDILKRLGIEIFYTQEIASISDLEKTIETFGALVRKPLKAELLNIFIQAAFLAIDNWCSAQDPQDTSVLITSYYSHFSMPGTLSLSDQLLQKLVEKRSVSLYRTDNQVGVFSSALSEEEIACFNPERLIIFTNNKESMAACLLAKKSLANLAALKKQNIHFIAEDVQWTPSQFLVLAYYDLARALCD